MSSALLMEPTPTGNEPADTTTDTAGNSLFARMLGTCARSAGNSTVAKRHDALSATGSKGSLDVCTIGTSF